MAGVETIAGVSGAAEPGAVPVATPLSAPGVAGTLGTTLEREVPLPVVAEPGVAPWDDAALVPALDLPAASPRLEKATRALSVLVSSIALALLAPVMLATAIAVKATSRGPILYRQIRVGMDRRRRGTSATTTELPYDRRMQDLGGSPFTIYKFRSMRVDAERGGRPVWAQKRDPRITPIGHFIRKTRLDELPQLINVINGDMNVVGPRPERPSIILRLRRHIAEYPLRLRVRPGITGWAQINQAYDETLEDVRRKVRLDLEYIRNRSVWQDLKIMALTIPVMVLRKGSR